MSIFPFSLNQQAWLQLASSCRTLLVPRSLFSLTAAAASGSTDVHVAIERIMEPIGTGPGACERAFAPPAMWERKRQSVHLGFP